MITVSNVTKDFGNDKGVFDLNFSIKQGEIFGFLGPNGAGKSTTIRMLMGFMNPDDGRVEIDGLNAFSQRDAIQKHTGYIAGEISLDDEMTGRKFLRFMLHARGIKDESRMNELIHLLQLDDSVKIGKMSKGMKQKVAITNALMHSPSVLILDEPTSGLDPLVQQIFMSLMMEEKKKGTTILMSSHSFTEVSRTCDTICIIKDGRIMDIDDIHHIEQNARQHYRIKFCSEAEAQQFAAAYPESVIDKNMISYTHKGETDALIKSLAQYSVEHMTIENESLEEIFMHYYDRRDKA